MNVLTNNVLMIKPHNFFFNEETAVNNAYQQDSKESVDIIQKKALLEFDGLVEKLEKVGINVHVLNDTSTPSTPDSIFPNNWFSSHKNKKLVIYPMFAENRRLERTKFLKDLEEIVSIKDSDVLDLTSFEKEKLFLEGTGALVLDRINKIAYCSLSPRASQEVLDEFCRKMDYTSISFTSSQNFNGKDIPIYHTNVMMGIGEKFVVVCLESIKNLEERKKVMDSFIKSKKEIIDISLKQVLSFSGNILELKNNRGRNFVLMSKTAYDGFTKEQRLALEKYSEIIYSDIPTIEFNGGGSVRCMIAELFI